MKSFLLKNEAFDCQHARFLSLSGCHSRLSTSKGKKERCSGSQQTDDPRLRTDCKVVTFIGLTLDSFLITCWFHRLMPCLFSKRTVVEGEPAVGSLPRLWLSSNDYFHLMKRIDGYLLNSLSILEPSQSE